MGGGRERAKGRKNSTKLMIGRVTYFVGFDDLLPLDGLSSFRCDFLSDEILCFFFLCEDLARLSWFIVK